MTRAVLDVNVLVAAVINPRGTPAECVRAFADGRFELLASPQLVAELRAVLGRPRLRPFVAPDAAERFVVALARDARVVADPREPDRVSRDRGDDYLVALARAAGAHVLVTGDDDLLDLDLADIAVVSPREFLALLPA